MADLLINADFSKRVLMRAADAVWAPSPAPGVMRRMLDRIGGEVARATSIVCYEPGSIFPEHRHDCGEEFLVLEGIFSDATGDFRAGTYVRNPPGTSHAPWTRNGCVIFVKLRQMHDDDRAFVRIDTNVHPWSDGRMALYEGPQERVELLRIPAGTSFSLGGGRGIEVLVLSGALRTDGLECEMHDWLRLPPSEKVIAQAQSDLVLWAKCSAFPTESNE